MTIEQTYYPSPGLNQIYDASIAYVKILMVARTGQVHTETDIDATLVSGGLFYMYSPSEGSIIFNPNNPFLSGESVNIIYDPNI